jgi:hypothetical protein
LLAYLQGLHALTKVGILWACVSLKAIAVTIYANKLEDKNHELIAPKTPRWVPRLELSKAELGPREKSKLCNRASWLYNRVLRDEIMS